jgi:hypothetical protein
MIEDVYMGPAGPVSAWRVQSLGGHGVKWPEWLARRFGPTFPFKPDTFRLNAYGDAFIVQHADPGVPEFLVREGEWILLDAAGHFGVMNDVTFRRTYRPLRPVEDETAATADVATEAAVEPAPGGKTLRDEFAMAAPRERVDFPDVRAAADFVGVTEPVAGDFVALARLSAAVQAKLAYIYADAMLAERQKGGAP